MAPATIVPGFDQGPLYSVLAAEKHGTSTAHAWYKEPRLPGEPRSVKTPVELFYESCLSQSVVLQDHVGQYICSSFPQSARGRLVKQPYSFWSAPNGFLNSCIKAYFEHLKLIFRPDDVWLAILVQYRIFLDKKHGNLNEDKVFKLRVPEEMFNSGLVDIAEEVTKLPMDYQDNPCMAYFTTTTQDDIVAATIIRGGSTCRKFDYGANVGCGIPEVTLEGTFEDWRRLLIYVQVLLGPDMPNDEVAKWYTLLEPVLMHFIACFILEPRTDQLKSFWARILHHHRGGSNQPNHYSGWLTVFSFWAEDGRCLWTEPNGVVDERLDIDPAVMEDLVAARLVLDPKWYRKVRLMSGVSSALRTNPVCYHRIRTSDVVQGWTMAEVRFVEEHDGKILDKIVVIAGSVGMTFEDNQSANPENPAYHRVRPKVGWFAFASRFMLPVLCDLTLGGDDVVMPSIEI